MVKLRKEKILVSLVVITLVALVFGNISSLATAPVITPSTSGGNTENTTGAVSDGNNENTNANVNTSGSISATVGASSNGAVNSTVPANNEAKNTNRNTNNTLSSKLPYAGSSSSVVFIVIALVASALYAYKKVSDYNV